MLFSPRVCTDCGGGGCPSEFKPHWVALFSGLVSERTDLCDHRYRGMTQQWQSFYFLWYIFKCEYHSVPILLHSFVFYSFKKIKFLSPVERSHFVSHLHVCSYSCSKWDLHLNQTHAHTTRFYFIWLEFPKFPRELELGFAVQTTHPVWKLQTMKTESTLHKGYKSLPGRSLCLYPKIFNDLPEISSSFPLKKMPH